MDEDTKNTINYESIDIESIASNMVQYGEGEVTLVDTYWNEGIALIQLNNPKKLNAVSGKMMVDFRKCIATLEQWNEGKAVILYGQGDNFCSGGDLHFARTNNTMQDGFHLSALMQDVLSRLENLPMLSVALIQGPTLGGGAEIAIACDYMLACSDIKFAFVHGTMGIITAWGGTTRLTKTLCPKQAMELLQTSRILDAQECVKLGLVSEIISTDTKLEDCLNWTREHVKHHYTVTRAFKKAVQTCCQNSMHDVSLRAEMNLFVPLWGGEANRAALSKNIKHVKKV